MNDAVIRFAGIRLSHNPKTLKIQRRKKLRSERLLSGEGALETVAEEPSVISGTAELFGEECFRDFEKLSRLCKSCSFSPLSIPYFGAFRAVLSDLTLTAEPRYDHISVGFTFRIAQDPPGDESFLPQYCRANSGDSFWDISYRFNVPVEELIELNKGIRDIMCLEDQERVRLF